ncbi:uncharacterized protein SPAPADRAFT_139387 [Spathaspora passalidarum NRRL Y-27907]|uniref:Holocytochrome c-type synthase n=1 Tax=Spathaspora passalidarum (strain NRRL Y-27907 / 11-Y1) TaxID=619300 RepID=G3ANH2_SPAPN|nr:uncharacterized protein SPAPADRAFT_139387 [Spathaspora passalidarum NRRL Y-27907]EGW31961.1 hypothetical protein SPAPADRAFT_139387 [Spathaspora passalidarum NRRL Y-27907]
MGWFWADSKARSINDSVSTPASSGCPIDHSSFISACPVKGSGGNNEELNPLNNMPVNLSSQRAPGQKLALSTTRTFSTIPRGETEDNGVWEYPSPQQMLNAMLRKGKGDGIPEDAVESMVDVHNFLNEGAWQQILDWENKYTLETKVEPRLKQFTGKPHDLSPRAQLFLWLGKFFPEQFNTQPPFDRHDWTVLRSQGKEQGWKEVRYIIDYYSAPDDEDTGMPAFMLDTRPALDNFENASDRIIRWAKPIWKKAMGEPDTD